MDRLRRAWKDVAINNAAISPIIAFFAKISFLKNKTAIIIPATIATISISPISPFRPRRWKGKIVSDKTKIYISNIDSKKRPIAAVADNNEIRNIAKVKIMINKRIKCKLLFNSKESLTKKIKLEQKKSFNWLWNFVIKMIFAQVPRFIFD